MKYQILKRHFHKDLVLLLSVVSTKTGTAAMWSTHKVEGVRMPFEAMVTRLQRSHDKQIDKMIKEDYLNEPEQFKIKTVQKVTQAALNNKQ